MGVHMVLAASHKPAAPRFAAAFTAARAHNDVKVGLIFFTAASQAEAEGKAMRFASATLPPEQGWLPPRVRVCRVDAHACDADIPAD